MEDINHEIKAKMSEIFNRCDGDLVDILFLAAKLELEQEKSEKETREIIEEISKLDKSNDNES